VQASDGTFTDHVHVTWDAVTGADSYEVWRNTTNDPATATKLAGNLTTTSYDDNTATPGVTYYYWLKATDSNGTSGFSTPDTGFAATVSTPTGGLTILTNGLESAPLNGTDDWLTNMENSIADQIGGTVAEYTLKLTVARPKANPHAHPQGIGKLKLTLTNDNGITLAKADSGQAILKVDWSAVSGLKHENLPHFPIALPFISTSKVARVASKFLGSDATAQELLGLPLHFIGVGRGVSLNAALVNHIGKDVQQFTSLDAHPTHNDAPVTFVNAKVALLDNYFEEHPGGSSSRRSKDPQGLYFNPTTVGNAQLVYNTYLNPAVTFPAGSGTPLGYTGKYVNQADTHLWYQGTIDGANTYTENGQDVKISDQWYPAALGGRKSGFFYSSTGGGSVSPLQSDIHGGSNTSNATDEGTLGSSLIIRDYVANSAPNEFYKFTVLTKTQFTANLSGLIDDANLSLQGPNTSLVSTNAGTADEQISATLDPGTYFLDVSLASPDAQQFKGTNFLLDLSGTATSIVNTVLPKTAETPSSPPIAATTPTLASQVFTGVADPLDRASNTLVQH
jgi:hypothetical protein